MESNTHHGERMYSVIINNIVAYTFSAKFESIYKAAAEKSALELELAAARAEVAAGAAELVASRAETAAAAEAAAAGKAAAEEARAEKAALEAKVAAARDFRIEQQQQQQQQQQQSGGGGRPAAAGGVTTESVLACLALVPALRELEPKARATLASNAAPLAFAAGEVVVASGTSSPARPAAPKRTRARDSRPKPADGGTPAAPLASLVQAEGEPADCMYIVHHGTAAAEIGGTAVASYEAGDYFGELGLINDAPRWARR